MQNNNLQPCNCQNKRDDQFYERLTTFYFFNKIFQLLENPAIIDRIIRHLKLSFQAERPPPSHVVHQELLMAAEEMEEYYERSDAEPKTKFLSNMLKGLKERGVVYEENAEKLDK